jgi:hypothetical protein
MVMLNRLPNYSAGSGPRIESVIERLIAHVNGAHHWQTIKHFFIDDSSFSLSLVH